MTRDPYIFSVCSQLYTSTDDFLFAHDTLGFGLDSTSDVCYHTYPLDSLYIFTIQYAIYWQVSREQML